VTAGVTRLAFPRRDITEALAYDPTWAVVVSGEKTAKSYVIDPLDNNLHDGQVGTYSSAPPLVAVREFGKGRIVFISTPPLHAILNFGNPLWPGTVETTGDPATHRPSDGHRLLVNALRWAAEPSQNIAGLGGRQVPKTARPIQWPAEIRVAAPSSRPRSFPPKDPVAPKRGLIGVHSSYSDGKGSPAEYADAAQAAGLSFVVFSEGLESLTPEKWAALVDDCAQISKSGKIYACPGYEYSDANGCRWAIWGENVIFPKPSLRGTDEQSIFRDGKLDYLSSFAPRMLLTYDKLPGDAANMWWFYRLPLFVYNGDKLLADNREQYLFALQELFALPVACFTRVHSPAEVAAASQRVTLNYAPDENPRERINSHASTWGSASYVSQGGAQGPQIETFQVSESQSDKNLYMTAGTQRSRAYFRAYSPIGLREILLHDGTRGILRRYLPNGAKDFWHDFEILHDSQHELVLEAIDMQGRHAIWSEIRMFSYKQGLYRCGDNLNMLCSVPILAHPDRHEMPNFPGFENWGLYTLQGFDTGSGVLTAPQGHLSSFRAQTTEGTQGPHQLRNAAGNEAPRGVENQMPTRLPMNSMEICVWDVTNERYVNTFSGDTAQGLYLPAGPDLEYATRKHRVYLLRSRANLYLTYDYRRAHEGLADYQGDVFIHQGTLRFKRDVTLAGTLPVELERVLLEGGSQYGIGDTLVLSDKEKGPRTVKFTDQPISLSGALPRGGFIAGGPSDVGALAVVPVSDNLVYNVTTSTASPTSLSWSYYVGLGHAGQQFKAGDEVRYAYLTVSLSKELPLTEATLTALADSFGLRGAAPLNVTPSAGKITSIDGFTTASAQDGEFEAIFIAAPMIINRPFKVEGLTDNGTAAVYMLEGDDHMKRFRFVPMFEGAALFQQNLDHGSRLWAGNVFIADNPSLKLTPVLYGLEPGEQPFLEIHNPTDREISATIKSPPNTPDFAGFSHEVTVSAGSDLRLPIKPTTP
jgi:hypothetical protein